MIHAAWHKLIVDLFDDSKQYYIKLRGPELDHLTGLGSLHSVATPALDCSGGDGTSEQLGSILIALLSRGRSIEREEGRDLC